MFMLAESGMSEGVFALAGAIVGGALTFFCSSWQVKREAEHKRHEHLLNECAKLLSFCVMMEIRRKASELPPISPEQFQQTLEVVTRILLLSNSKQPQEKELAQQAQRVWKLAYDNKEEVVFLNEVAKLGQKAETLLSSLR